MFRSANTGLGLFILRVVVGFIFLMHGLGKFFGPPFLGGGWEWWNGFVVQIGLPLPAVAVWAGALVETLGGLALITGAGASIAGLLLAVDMAIAILKVRLSSGLSAANGGYEFELVLLTAAVTIAVAGPGMLAIQIRPKNA